MSRNDEFYVGYFPKAPAGMARLTRLAVATVLVVALVAVLIFVREQRPFSNGSFEYGTVRDFTGTIALKPVPALRGNQTDQAGKETTFLLVAPFKHGADELVRAFDGRSVRLRGTLVERDGRRMIELVPGSIEPAGAPAALPPEIRLGEVDLVGEIVDSKCWLGVMKPGDRKTHRECASLCIRGGIPPLFVARGDGGSELATLLVSSDGAPVNEQVLPFVAEPVRIRGTLSRQGDVLVLRADPASIERIR